MIFHLKIIDLILYVNSLLPYKETFADLRDLELVIFGGLTQPIRASLMAQW